MRGTVKEVVDLHRYDEREPAAFELKVSGVDAALVEPLGTVRDANGRSGPRRVTVTLPDRVRLRQAMTLVEDHGGQVEALTPITPSLEDRFLSYIRRGTCGRVIVPSPRASSASPCCRT